MGEFLFICWYASRIIQGVCSSSHFSRWKVRAGRCTVIPLQLTLELGPFIRAQLLGTESRPSRCEVRIGRCTGILVHLLVRCAHDAGRLFVQSLFSLEGESRTVYSNSIAIDVGTGVFHQSPALGQLGSSACCSSCLSSSDLNL